MVPVRSGVTGWVFPQKRLSPTLYLADANNADNNKKSQRKGLSFAGESTAGLWVSGACWLSCPQLVSAHGASCRHGGAVLEACKGAAGYPPQGEEAAGKRQPQPRRPLLALEWRSAPHTHFIAGGFTVAARGRGRGAGASRGGPRRRPPRGPGGCRWVLWACWGTGWARAYATDPCPCRAVSQQMTS